MKPVFLEKMVAICARTYIEKSGRQNDRGWELMEENRSWAIWLIRGTAAINLTAVVLTLLFLTRGSADSLGERMYYISSNETAVIWSWGSNLLAVLAMTGVLVALFQVLDPEYRLVLQMALCIWVIGAVSWILHDLIQMIYMPALSQLFLEVPTQQLAGHIMEWENLLGRLLGLFACSCLAVSGYIFTAVMYRTDNISNGFIRYSLIVWSVVLLSAFSFRWSPVLLPWMTACSLLLLVPWSWWLTDELVRLLAARKRVAAARG